MDGVRLSDDEAGRVRLFLCGDVMPGRGIDQIMPCPSRPQLFEPYVRDARDYVALAEAANGPLPRHVGPEYVWGDALAELDRRTPDLRLVNLETSITTCDDYWPGKGINYRMHPANTPLLEAAGIDCCVLANNHVLDWGYKGLADTLERLGMAGIVAVGAGLDAESARRPEVFGLPGGRRLIVSAWADESSGVPKDWRARSRRPGVALLPDLSMETVEAIAEQIAGVRGPGDIVVVSIHWGSNWGYRIPEAQQRFARALIDRAGVDLVHGHSSHHPRPIEVHRGKLILFGCGDFLNDYEGIYGHEDFRGDLTLMYFADLEASTGALQALTLCPMRIANFRLNWATAGDTEWLQRLLNRIGMPFNTGVSAAGHGLLQLDW